MSVWPQEVGLYGSVNMTETDVATVGGAINLTRMISFSDMQSPGVLSAVSSSASDTATRVVVGGRDGAGILQTPTFTTLTGTTALAMGGGITFQRLLYGALSGTSGTGPLPDPLGTGAVGDVAIYNSTTPIITNHVPRAAGVGSSAQPTGTTPPTFGLTTGDGASVALGQIIRIIAGTGINQLRMICSTSGTGAGQYGTDCVAVNRAWDTLPDATSNYSVFAGFLFPRLPSLITSVVRPFSTVASDIVGGSSRVYYEKAFMLNSDGTTALTSPILTKQTDPSLLYAGGGALDIAACTALNDTNTVTQRLNPSAPTGIGAFSSGAAPQSVVPVSQTAASFTAAQSQGFWLKLTLPAGLAPNNTSFLIRPAGNTT